MPPEIFVFCEFFAEDIDNIIGTIYYDLIGKEEARMFLGNLAENEKKAFLFLADKVLRANNIVADEELALLCAFAQEMGLSEPKSSLSEDETYTILTGSENKVKRAVYMELLTLAFADNTFEEKEIKCLKDIQEKLGLPDTFSKKAKDWLNSYMEKTKEGFNFIEGGI